MKKYLPYIIAVVVVLGGAGAYLFMQKNNEQKETNSTSSKNDGKKADTKKYADACKIFTKEDIAAALGGTFGEGEEDIATNSGTPGSDNYEDTQGSACKFDQDNDGTTAGMTKSITLSIAVNNHESVDVAKTWMNNLHSPPTAEGQEAMDKPVDVDGAGDQAFFAKVNDGGTGTAEKTEVLYVRIGRQVIVLTATQLSGMNHDTMQAGLTTLAKKL